MKINLDLPPEDAQIQIIPLIDVIFCILTFFILASLQLTRQQAINVDLPRATTGATQTRDTLIVTINSTGQTYVDKQLVDRNQLYQLLQDYHQRNPNGILVLNASQTAFYNDVVQVLDLLRSVGGDRVALATLPTENKQPGGTLTAPLANPTTNPLNTFGTPSPTPTSNPGQFQFPPTSGQTPGLGGNLTTPLPNSNLTAPGSVVPGSPAPKASP